MSTWRVGRRLGRTIYRQFGNEPSDDDTLVGVTDWACDARRLVAALNGEPPPELLALVRESQNLRKQVNTVRTLHRKGEHRSSPALSIGASPLAACDVCRDDNDNLMAWPCPTIRALDMYADPDEEER